MWPLLVLGIVGLATAAWFAWRAEGRVRGFLDSMSRAIVCVTLATLALALKESAIDHQAFASRFHEMLRSGAAAW